MRHGRGAPTARYCALISRPARGVTLIEVLVVIGIVGVLIALLLPAVQAVREAGRRIQCQDRVRQIGLALQKHESAHGALPPGWVSEAPDGNPGWGWGAMILAHVEQQAVFNGSGSGPGPGGPGPGGPGPGAKPISHPDNQRARETPIPSFLCPSDTSEEVFMLHQGGPGGGGGGKPMFEVARANYVGVFGTQDIDANPKAGDGAFYENSSVPFAAILDGLANTLLVGERCSRLGSATWVGAVPGAHQGRQRVVGRAGSVPNHVLNDFADFSSEHPFGANFVMGDGSVRPISDQIDLTVFRALATRAGKEAVPPPP